MLTKLTNDFVSLLYPDTCSSCGKLLYKGENCICLKCVYSLPRTYYHLWPDNPMERMFWGKTDIVHASSFCSYSKGGMVQKLIHSLKYFGTQEIGLKLGTLYARELLKAEWINSIDCLIPVPLHKIKQQKRGFNQSELIADGMAPILSKEVCKDILVRRKASSTQTKKEKFIRWKNVESKFSIQNHETLKNKHIMLIDDVMTTGSTLEACTIALREIPGINISVATIACA